MRFGPSPTSPGSTLSGTTRPAPGRRTTACGSTTFYCRHRPATGSPMSASTAMCAAGRSRRTTCRYGRIWISRRRDAPPSSHLLAAALHPLLQHLEAHGAVVVGRLGEGAVVAFLDPGLFGTGAVTRQRQPHQAARGLPRQLVAVEQHLAEQRLRLVLALLGGEPEPARAIAEILARGVRGLQIQPGEIVLRIRIAEIGGRIGEHLPRPVRVRLDLRVRNAI